MPATPGVPGGAWGAHDPVFAREDESLCTVCAQGGVADVGIAVSGHTSSFVWSFGLR